MRYVTALKARGVTVTLVSPPPLVRLFEPVGVNVLPALSGMAVERHDAWVLIASLPGRFETTLENIPARALSAGAGA